jgi:hypothetical protein
MRIAIVALRKIGLPVAVQFVSKGHEVIGIDIDPTVRRAGERRWEPFPGVARLKSSYAVWLGQDLIGGLGPGEGVGAFCPAVDVGLDRDDQVGERGEGAAADRLPGDDPEEDLDQGSATIQMSG